DKLVVMSKGRVEQQGTPLSLYTRPATTFVATFIGAPPMNLITVEEGATGLSAMGISGGANLPIPPKGAILGVRPEHLEASTLAPPEGGIALTLKVTAVEAVGAETYVYGPLGPKAQEIIARLPGTATIAPGDTVTLVAPREQLHLFDRETGHRLEP
ncbi:MAG: TOBE domain-containing protein, partial [Alphaproteobacteria bacterium]